MMMLSCSKIDSIPIKIHVLGSAHANLNPWKKVCCLESTQSSSPISSCNRHAAKVFSSLLSQVVVRGKSGKIKNAKAAMPMVIAPCVKLSVWQLGGHTAFRNTHLNNKEPSPSTKSVGTIHTPGDSGRY